MWLKLIPYLAVAAASFIGGLSFQAKVLAPKIEIPPCPQVEIPPCPPQTSIDLQNFDVHKIKNIRTFTYSPTISGNVQIVVDTVTYRKLTEKK